MRSGFLYSQLPGECSTFWLSWFRPSNYWAAAILLQVWKERLHGILMDMKLLLQQTHLNFGTLYIVYEYCFWAPFWAFFAGGSGAPWPFYCCSHCQKWAKSWCGDFNASRAPEWEFFRHNKLDGHTGITGAAFQECQMMCVSSLFRSLRHFYSRSFTTTNQQELAPGDRQCKVAWSFKKQQDRLAGWGGGPSYPRHHKAAGALIYGQLRKIDMDRRSCLQPIAKIHPKNRQYATVSGPPAAQNYSPAYQFAWPAKNHLQRILKKPIFSNIWSVKSKHLSKFSIGILERFWRLSLHSTVIPRYRCPKPFQNRSMYWKGVASKIYDGPSNIAEKKLAPSPHMIWLTFCLTCNFSICSKMFTSLAACIISKVI